MTQIYDILRYNGEITPGAYYCKSGREKSHIFGTMTLDLARWDHGDCPKQACYRRMLWVPSSHDNHQIVAKPPCSPQNAVSTALLDAAVQVDSQAAQLAPALLVEPPE